MPDADAPREPVTTADDASLLAATAAGEASAFALFLQRHEAAVYRYAHLLTRDRADAEEATQDAFVAAWRGAAGFRGGETARPWLLAITRREVIRQRRARRDEPTEAETLEVLADQAGWGDPAAAGGASSAERIGLALDALPAGDRDVLVLRDIEGLAPDAAAEQLGLSVAAFKSRLHRARLKLAAALREVMP
ncbi:MAG: sigma-70 family RNA polymerase sigma factor [Gemmatimonadaceae bacterium]|nr:sigma-70 family RNA polymerase sigma factor [Gemmatimonadaceae bacterium]